MTDIRSLRKFAAVLAGFFVLFLALLPYLVSSKVHIWPLYVAGALLIEAALFPKTLAPVHKLWTKLGEVLGAINSRIILGLFFVLFFTPVAIARKLTGKDPLHRKPDTKKSTYRIQREKTNSKKNMENTF